MSTNIVTIENSVQRVSIRPDLGGSLSSCEIFNGSGWESLMRTVSSPETVLDTACFPMLPFCGRINKAEFPFEADMLKLKPNSGFEPHSIHGYGWLQPWETILHKDNEVRLYYRHGADEWPWEFEAFMSYLIDGPDLKLTINLQNLSDKPMPCGFGFHPYFMKNGSTYLYSSAEEVWLVNDSCIPERKAPADDQWSLDRNTPISQLICDNNFVNWNQNARIEWKDRKINLSLEADPVFAHVVVFSPERENFFCVEPVTNVADAFNLAPKGDKDTGMLLLAPGERVEGSMKFHWTFDH